MSGVWVLKISGVASNEFQRKNEAVAEAKRLAKTDNEQSKVVVEKQSGATQNTFTYEPSGSEPSWGLGL